jgi:4-nitrophenyl phosphatase
MTFAGLDGVILDMDGVLWRGNEALPGAAAFLDWLRSRGIPFALASNNSSRTPRDFVRKCAQLGLGIIDERHIVNSGAVAVAYLLAHYPPGTPVYVLGGDGLKEMVVRAGFPLSDADKVPVVLVGIDFNLTYERLKRAAYLVRGGAAFVGTNADATFPMPDGQAPGAGSLLALLHTATGVAPRVMGKPEAPMYHAAMQVLGTQPASTLMIGDRLDTDIAGARRLGMPAALVLTGVTEDEERAIPVLPGEQPTVTVPDLPALQVLWQAAL